MVNLTRFIQFVEGIEYARILWRNDRSCSDLHARGGYSLYRPCNPRMVQSISWFICHHNIGTCYGDHVISYCRFNDLMINPTMLQRFKYF